MKKWCRTVGTIILVLGIIGSIIIAQHFGIEVRDYGIYGHSVKRDWIKTIVIFFLCVISDTLCATIFLAIAQILENQEIIIRRENGNSIEAISSNSTSSLFRDDFWVCPQCGKENPNYTGTCGCGCRKPQ